MSIITIEHVEATLDGKIRAAGRGAYLNARGLKPYIGRKVKIVVLEAQEERRR